MGRETEGEESAPIRIVFEGTARIGEVMSTFKSITLRPEDFASPIALQMALTRIYDTLMRSITETPKKTFIAEIKFTDSAGNTVVFAAELGTSPPPLPGTKVKARITVELLEEKSE
ncbi:MAG: hypothetical protein QXI22_02010 [Sulfolobales archaeon]